MGKTLNLQGTNAEETKQCEASLPFNYRIVILFTFDRIVTLLSARRIVSGIRSDDARCKATATCVYAMFKTILLTAVCNGSKSFSKSVFCIINRAAMV